MDRNVCPKKIGRLLVVALRKESVDRNYGCWCPCYSRYSVALRKESVDRNFVPFDVIRPAIESLSARRAWIEMLASRLADMSDAVALRKESVDRNSNINTRGSVKMGRSPQGERG